MQFVKDFPILNGWQVADSHSSVVLHKKRNQKLVYCDVNLWGTHVTRLYRTLCKEPAAWIKLAESNDDRAILHREKNYIVL